MRGRILINEADEEVTVDDSLDAQVYAFFTQAESSALNSAEARGGLGPFTVESALRKTSLKFLLAEQEGAASPAETEGEETEKEFHVEVFASEVSRLVKNADTLLDLKNTIMEMAKKYLADKYDDDTAIAFDDTMKAQHDLEIVDPDSPDDMGGHFAVGARSAGA